MKTDCDYKFYFESLISLCDISPDGTNGIITMFQDELKHDWVIRVGNRLYHSDSIYEAIEEALKDKVK